MHAEFTDIRIVSAYMYIYTQRLQRSSFLVMVFFLLRGYNILPKKELLLSLWVYIYMMVARNVDYKDSDPCTFRSGIEAMISGSAQVIDVLVRASPQLVVRSSFSQASRRGRSCPTT